MEVLDVEIFCVSAVYGSGEAYDFSCAVIVEVQRIGISNIRRQLAALPDVAMSYTVDGLACAQTGLVIGKAQRVAALGFGRLAVAVDAKRRYVVRGNYAGFWM